MLLREFIKDSVSSLEALYPQQEARSIVDWLLEERLGVKNYTSVVEPGFEIPENALAGLQHDMERLCATEPIQYVLGVAEFCSRRFKVCPSVLIPRPETECLVALALDGLRPGSAVLDLCTGSGCIAWTIAKEAPQSRVVAVDISEEALRVARSQFEERAVEFRCADILVEGSIEGQYDLIVSNPPYILQSERPHMRSNVLEHEPHLALFVEDDDPLVFYRAVARIAAVHLLPEGKGVVEINEMLGEQTAEVFRDAGLREVTIHEDYLHKQRNITFIK